MKTPTGLEVGADAPVPALAHLLRERDQLILLHEALGDVERACTTEDRLEILVQAIRRIGYGRVDTVIDYTMPPSARVVAWISKSVVLESDDLIVPVRSVDGTMVATLVLSEPDDPRPPNLTRVRTVELFAQHVASIIENARLYEESQRYSRLVESAVDGIFTLDANGLLTSVNQSLEAASGRPRDVLIGVRFAELVDPRDAAIADEAVRAATRGEHRRMELRYIGLEGDARHCSLTLTPLADGGALGIVRDMTDEKRFGEQLMQQEKLAAVGQLVSGVAHELNNPLASVTAFAQLLLLSDPSEPFERGAVEAIDQEARRASKIVSNLLTFARQHQPERRVADLNQVVEETLELRRYALRNAHVDLETTYDPQLPLTWADPFQLQQVVLNLVTNAEHALASWSGMRTIGVSTSSIGDHLMIRVADTGPGIAPEHLHRLFNPFFTTKPVGEGTGLGLSISDGIVREHQGRIRVESQPGEGAAFIVELPYAPPPMPSVPASSILVP